MAFEVAKGLAREGWEIYVGYERDGIWRERYAPFTKSFHPIRLPVLTFRRPGELIVACVRLYRLMRRLGIRCLFTSYNGHLLVAALLEKFCGVRSCFHLGLTGSVANTVSGRWAIRQISAGVAPSEQTAESWRRIGWPNGTIHVVPNWIDWEEYSELPTKEEARKKLGIWDMGYGISQGKQKVESGKEPKVVAYVGRLVPEKGIEVLLEAWNQGFAQDEDTVLLVAGTGKAEYEAKLKAKAAKNVRFLGGLEDTKPVYRASDLTAVPSLWEEPFGLVPLEAVACGSLPLVSDRGFLPEIVKETEHCLIHPSGNAEKLSEVMQRWLSADTTSLCRKLLEKCQKTYSPEAGLKAYENVLQLP